MIFVMVILIGALGSLIAISVAYRKLREGQQESALRGGQQESAILVAASIVDESSIEYASIENESQRVLEENIVKEEYGVCEEIYVTEEIEEEEEIQCERVEETNVDDEELWETRRVTALVAYLERNYWKRSTSSASTSFHRESSRADLRPVLRISSSPRKIHIVYSKNTIWDLAFSENLHCNKNEKFAFIFKGVKSWAIEETRGRFADVMQDLFEFRAEIRQELTNQKADLFGELPECCRTMQEMGELITEGKIKTPKPMVPVCGNPVGHDVVCQGSQLQIMGQENMDFKLAPPEGLELLIPSVCFVIPSKETEVAGQSCGMEVEFKHLMTAWSDKEFETKQELTSSQIMSILKVFKPPIEDQQEVPPEEFPCEELPVEELPVEELPVEEVPAEELPVEELPVEELPVEELPVEELPEEVPVESPVEELPNEQTPHVEIPIEEEMMIEETPGTEELAVLQADVEMTTFKDELILEPLILETLRTDEQILDDLDLDESITPPSYVVSDVKIPMKESHLFDDCYDALLLRDNVVCQGDVTRDNRVSQPRDTTLVSSDRFQEDDISIATIEELLYRLKNIEQVLDSCEPLQGSGFLGGNFPGKNHPHNLEILQQLQHELDDELYPQYKQITIATTTSGKDNDVSRRVRFLTERWNMVTFEVGERRRRAAGSDVDDGIAEALTVFLRDVEQVLTAQPGITALPEDLDIQYDELRRLQNGFESCQGVLNSLKHSAGEGSMPVYHHHGGGKVAGIVSRWETAFVQTSARIQQLTNIRGRVAKFREGLLRETAWLEKVYEKFKRDDAEVFTRRCGGPPGGEPAQRSPHHRPPCKTQNRRTVRLLKEYARISRKLTRRRRSIQSIFYGAEEFILCSKMYEKDLKDFYSTVNGCHDNTCRYEVERSRDWVANMTLKLSQLYEAVISEVLHRTNILLASGSPEGDGNTYDGDNGFDYDGDDATGDEMEVSDDDGDNHLSARSKSDNEGDSEVRKGGHKGEKNKKKSDNYEGDNSYYWEDEFEDVMKWMEVRELDLANQMPSYKSMAELSAYVSKLQHIRSDIVSNDEKISNTLEAFYEALRKSPKAVADNGQNDSSILSKIVPLELRWSKLQWESEGRNARVAALHDVTHNYDNVCQPFLKWLRKAETQSETFAREWDLIDAIDVSHNVSHNESNGLSHFARVESLCTRETHFLHDVTHRVEDLRKVNRYGEQLVSLVKEFQTYITDFPDSLSSGVDGTSQIWDLERSLYEINARFRTLQYSLEARKSSHTSFIEKYRKFLGMIETYIGWLSKTDGDLGVVMLETHNEGRERTAWKHDAVTRLRHDIENHFSELVAIETASNILTTTYHSNVNNNTQTRSCENRPMFWETITTSLFPRYENLYDNIRHAESRLYSYLVSSCSVCEGIDVLVKRVVSVEQSLTEMGPVSSDPFILSRQIKKTRAATFELNLVRASMEAVSDKMTKTTLEKDNVSERWDSLNKLCVEVKFETHYKHDRCIVSCLENISTLQHWLSTVSAQNCNTSKNADVTSATEKISDMKTTLTSREQLFILIEECGRELMLMELHEHHDDPDEMADLAAAVNNLSNNWQAVSMDMMLLTKHMEEISLRWRVFETIFQPLYKWLDTMEETLSRFIGPSLNVRTLSSQVREHRSLLNEAYSHNGTLEAYTSMVESALYDMYAKHPHPKRMSDEYGACAQPNSCELGRVKQIRDRFHNILSVLECRHVTLKSVLTQIEEYLSAYRQLTTWLKCTAHAQISTTPSQTTLRGTMQQFQTALMYERDLDRVSEQVEHMLKLGRALVAGKQGGRSDDVTAIKIENEKIRLRWEVICKMAEKNIQLFRNALEKSFVEEHVRVTCLLEAKHVHMTWNVLLHVDGAGSEPAETYVNELMRELTEYESDVRVFYCVGELIRMQCAGSDVRVKLLTHEMHEAWNKIVRYVNTSQFLCDVISLKTTEQIYDEIQRENEKGSDDKDAEKARETVEESVDLTSCRNHSQLPDTLPHSLHHSHKALFKPSMCSSCDEKSNLNTHLQLGCSKINTLEKYTFLRSTVERHTRVDGSHTCNKPECNGRLTDAQVLSDEPTIVGASSSALLPDDSLLSKIPCAYEEVFASADDQVSKIKTTNTRQVERYIVRRKYVDTNGEECIEEREISDDEARSYLSDDGKNELDNGKVVIFRTPDDHESTTTEEEFVRDGEGNVTEWIVRKKTRHTKRTRIVRKTVVRETKTDDQDVPVSDTSSEDVKDGECNAKHGRVVKRPDPPSFTLTDESMPSSVTSSPSHRVVKRPPVPISIVATPRSFQPIKLRGHCGGYWEAPNDHVTFILPSNDVKNNADTDSDNNDNDSTEHFPTVNLRCVKGLVKNSETHVCPCPNHQSDSDEMGEVSCQTYSLSNGTDEHSNSADHRSNGDYYHSNHSNGAGEHNGENHQSNENHEHSVFLRSNGADHLNNNTNHHNNGTNHQNGITYHHDSTNQTSNGSNFHSNGLKHYSNGHSSNGVASESSLLKAFSSDGNYKEIEVVGFTEKEEREESEVFRFERGHTLTTNYTKIIKGLDSNNNDSNSENIDTKHMEGDILSPDWLVQQRRKRVKVMIIVSDTTNDIMGQKCRTKYRISPRNSLYEESLPSPQLKDNSMHEETDQDEKFVVFKVPKPVENGVLGEARNVAQNGEINGVQNGQSGTTGSHQDIGSCPHCHLQRDDNGEPVTNGATNGVLYGTTNGELNGAHLRVKTVPQSELINETDENNSKTDKKRRKSSIVKITVGDHNNRQHSPTSPRSPKKQDGVGAVVVRDRHNRIRTLDVVPNTSSNFSACHPDWKPAMRLLTRNATKILVSHSNRCLVTGVNSNGCLVTRTDSGRIEDEHPLADDADSRTLTSET